MCFNNTLLLHLCMHTYLLVVRHRVNILVQSFILYELSFRFLTQSLIQTVAQEPNQREVNSVFMTMSMSEEL